MESQGKLYKSQGKLSELCVKNLVDTLQNMGFWLLELGWLVGTPNIKTYSLKSFFL